MSSEISKSIQIICDEKGLEYDAVMEAIEQALGAAFRKDFGTRQGNYKVQFDPDTGDMKVWDVKTVVADVEEEALEKAQEELASRREEARKDGRELSEEEMEDLVRFNPKTDIMITEAKEFKKTAKLDDVLEIKQEVPGDFGRMAAQTAKQVIIQKLREAERQTVFADFKTQEEQIVQGTVQRRDRNGSVIIDLGKITGIVPQAEQINREQYRPGNRMRFFVVSVAMGTRGPEIILSRSNNKMVQVVFESEIPEIQDESVVIKGIARDAGNRSKVSVMTDDDTIDPIGACIGQRGSRITTVISELGGEKVDIIQFDENAVQYIKNALSPAKIDSVELNEETKEATANVSSDQFSLAIGRGGQNVRLAAELTGWKINVMQEGGEDVVVSSEDPEDVIEEKIIGDEESSVDAEEKEDKKESEASEEESEKKTENVGDENLSTDLPAGEVDISTEDAEGEQDKEESPAKETKKKKKKDALAEEVIEEKNSPTPEASQDKEEEVSEENVEEEKIEDVAKDKEEKKEE